MVKSNIQEDDLHAGHIQLWNRSRYPLSKYVAEHGFRIVPMHTSPRAFDVTTFRGMVKSLGHHGYRMGRVLSDYLAVKTGRFNRNNFYAIKRD
jgi:hypothetical protein